jgi:hypothetical protein
MSASPSSSLLRPGRSPLLCIAIVGYDGVVHWNVHFTARRASLPIDPNIAALYAAWGIVSTPAELLSNYEHSVLRPSSVVLAEEVAKVVPTRLLPIISDGAFGTPEATLITVPAGSGGTVERVEAHAVDINGCVLLVFSQMRGSGSAQDAPADDDPYYRPRLTASYSVQLLACRMGAIVRCSCRPLADAALMSSILDPQSQPPTAWRERPEELLRCTKKHWETPVTLKSLHQSMVSIGCALVLCEHTECV